MTDDGPTVRQWPLPAPVGFLVGLVALLFLSPTPIAGAEPALIGYTELRTDLPGGRHANVQTMRACVMQVDGSGRKTIAEQLVDRPDAWTQFAGWSPDGAQAVVSVGWESPENARWEEEHKAFRMEPGQWLLDSCLVNVADGSVANVTAVERKSHYNGGLFFLMVGEGPERKPALGFTPVIQGISKPYLMDLDGRNKRDVSGNGTGFSYGYSASPDGRLISYHENYQVYVANADGTQKRHIKTGNQFDFAPRWSPDGQWLLFVSGEHYDCHPVIVRPDGTGLKKIADRGGYRGVTEFLDVFDFHGGSSDLPVWAGDGKSVYFTAKTGENIELFQVMLDGPVRQLTKSAPGTLHYHPTPSPDGRRLLIGSKRDGIRQLIVINLGDGTETQLTQLQRGHAAMWPHWQPRADSP